METSLENLNKAAINRGFIIAAISIFISILLYYVSPQSMVSAWFGFGIMFVMLIIYIYFTIDLRKAVGGFWSFKEALRGIFLMSVVAAVIGAVFNFIFYKFIEPSAYDKLAGFATENMTTMFEAMGLPEEKIDESVEESLKGIKDQFNPTPLSFIKSLGTTLLVSFIFSLIFAAIFKKERPVFAPTEE